MGGFSDMLLPLAALTEMYQQICVAQYHHSKNGISHPLTDPKAIASLLCAIKGYNGQLVTRCALQSAPLVFVRPGELRKAEWSEFNFETTEWRIPPEKSKRSAKYIF